MSGLESVNMLRAHALLLAVLSQLQRPDRAHRGGHAAHGLLVAREPRVSVRRVGSKKSGADLRGASA